MTNHPTYSVFANVERQNSSLVSTHRTLKAAGKAYQAAHTGNLRRVLDQDGNDVTAEACDAARASSPLRRSTTRCDSSRKTTTCAWM